MIKRNERVKSIFAKSNKTKEKIKVNKAIDRFAEAASHRLKMAGREIDYSQITASEMDCSQITAESYKTSNDAMNLSAIIQENKKPETSEQKEDRKHKTYFWLGLCVLVFLYAGFTKW